MYQKFEYENIFFLPLTFLYLWWHFKCLIFLSGDIKQWDTFQLSHSFTCGQLWNQFKCFSLQSFSFTYYSHIVVFQVWVFESHSTEFRFLKWLHNIFIHKIVIFMKSVPVFFFFAPLAATLSRIFLHRCFTVGKRVFFPFFSISYSCTTYPGALTCRSCLCVNDTQ